MRTPLLFSLLILLATITVSHAAPFFRPDQAYLGRDSCPSTAGNHIIHHPAPSKVRNAQELEALMQQVIVDEMTHAYHESKYIASLRSALRCYETFGVGWSPFNCKLKVLSAPQIQVIPVQRLTEDVLCSTSSCTIDRQQSTTVSTTHSLDAGLALKINSNPFSAGVSFTKSSNYKFSVANEKETSISYAFDLEKSDKGYVGLVGAQISAKILAQQCMCLYTPQMMYDCSICISEWKDVANGFHEAVIMQGDKPRSIVSFVQTD
ncbi:hypothetical protein BGZ73_002962 [Actinomortierella ambigua]|nr:hypothetical protein BGZ73_002962 [Actinomortierella ambigua]